MNDPDDALRESADRADHLRLFLGLGRAGREGLERSAVLKCEAVLTNAGGAGEVLEQLKAAVSCPIDLETHHTLRPRPCWRMSASSIPSIRVS
jgi:hypothetical protein